MNLKQLLNEDGTPASQATSDPTVPQMSHEDYLKFDQANKALQAKKSAAFDLIKTKSRFDAQAAQLQAQIESSAKQIESDEQALQIFVQGILNTNGLTGNYNISETEPHILTPVLAPSAQA